MWSDRRAPVTDAELLAAAEHDAAAFGELYRRHVRRVHAWFARRIDWAAADLTAETFARAWIRRGGFRDEHDGWALPWLLGIAHNVMRESARRDRIESQARERLGLPLDLAEDDGYTAVEDRLSPRIALAASLDELPDHERDALELRVLDELPYVRGAERRRHRRDPARPARACLRDAMMPRKRTRAWAGNLGRCRIRAVADRLLGGSRP